MSVLGTAYLEELGKEIEAANIPKMVGGAYEGYVADGQDYLFDKAFFCPKVVVRTTATPSHAATVAAASSAAAAAAATADDAMPPAPPS